MLYLDSSIFGEISPFLGKSRNSRIWIEKSFITLTPNGTTPHLAENLRVTKITSGLYYNSIYDRKNYDASYDRTSGVGIYDASVVIYDASSVNYDAKVL